MVKKFLLRIFVIGLVVSGATLSMLQIYLGWSELAGRELGDVLGTTVATVDINGGQQYQTFDGFGAQTYIFSSWANWHGVKMSDAFAGLKNDIGLDSLRIHFRYDCSSSEGCYLGSTGTNDLNAIKAAIRGTRVVGTNKHSTDTDSSTDTFLAKLAEAKQAGLKLVAVGFRLPTWAKSGDNFNPNSTPNPYNKFADMWQAIFEVAQEHGFTFDYVIITNEPNVKAETGVMTSGQWNTLYTTVKTRLSGLGFNPVYLGADAATSNSERTFSGVDSNVGIRSFHGYGGGSLTSTDLNTLPRLDNSGMRQLADSTSKPLWMSEWAPQSINSSNQDSIATAAMWAEHITNSLYYGDASGYIVWSVGEGGRDFFSGATSGALNYRLRAYGIKQFAKYLEPGMKRISATYSPASDTFVVAFSGSSKLRIIVVNRGAASQSLTFNLSNLGGVVTDFEQIRTSGATNEKAALIDPSIPAGATIAFPAMSVTTLLGDIETAPSGGVELLYAPGYDYNDNTLVDRQDLDKLAFSIYPDLTQCPVSYDCDLNNDAQLTATDVGLFTGIVDDNERLVDYDQDGQFDADDVFIIGQEYWPDLNRCPSNKICDINADGVLDIVDVQLLAYLVEIPYPAIDQIVDGLPVDLDPNQTGEAPDSILVAEPTPTLTTEPESEIAQPTSDSSDASSGQIVELSPLPAPLADQSAFPEPQAVTEEQIAERIENLEYEISPKEREVVTIERELVSRVDQELTNRLRGRIVLQAEEHGEAWYVDPNTKKKFYLPDGNTAYVALNAFGLGVTNEDLEKIPIGMNAQLSMTSTDTDGDGLDDQLEKIIGSNELVRDTDGDGFEDGVEIRNNYSPLSRERLSLDSRLSNQLKGRILLQVQKRGEAWYVNPADGKRYYMKNGESAYQIMRFLSLGISNENIRKIEVGSFQ